MARDGEIFIEETVTSTYELSYPNGESCGPECKSSEVIAIRD